LGGNLLYEEHADETYTSYTYIRNTRFTRENGNVDGSTDPVRYYYHTDHLGSTVLVTDETGEVIWDGEYTPFGELNDPLNIVDGVIQFTGKDMDFDTGLYYYNARWYDPGLGRFITEDPIRDGSNWYVYVNNNPLRFVDPSGLEGERSEWAMTSVPIYPDLTGEVTRPILILTVAVERIIGEDESGKEYLNYYTGQGMLKLDYDNESFKDQVMQLKIGHTEIEGDNKVYKGKISSIFIGLKGNFTKDEDKIGSIQSYMRLAKDAFTGGGSPGAMQFLTFVIGLGSKGEDIVNQWEGFSFEESGGLFFGPEIGDYDTVDNRDIASKKLSETSLHDSESFMKPFSLPNVSNPIELEVFDD
jgi:RHS repeat-associated protein